TRANRGASDSATGAAKVGGRLSLTRNTFGSLLGTPECPDVFVYTASSEGWATAAAVIPAPRVHSATCTAQSSRGGMPYSRVPSNGSMIHTRAAESLAAES